MTDKKGKASIIFWNNDALTTFRIIAEGMSINNQLGRTEQTYFTKLPFEFTAKMPAHFTVNDEVKIPMYMTNNTGEAIKGKIQVDDAGVFRFDNSSLEVEVAPQTTRMAYFTGVVMRTLKAKEADELKINFVNKQYPESIANRLEVFSTGFPIEQAFAGNKQTNDYKVTIPEVAGGSLKAELTAYPNVMGDLMEGIQGIIRRPYGCFEQVSSSTYPNILALQFLEQTGKTLPKVRDRALSYIADGYKKLAAYETRKKGFEWYGKTPPHEGLTAYGLMEFLEMQKVYGGVSNKMIERTKGWLLSRRDGKGNFKQNRGRYGFAAASRTVNNAYVVYALAFAGVKDDIAKEYKKAYKEATKSKDAYRMALLALAATHLNKPNDAKKLRSLLKNQLQKNEPGKLQAEQTIVRSGGVSRQIEASALMVLAELKQDKPDLVVVQKLINFMLSKRSRGYFGSTQGTILALKALTSYAGYQQSLSNEGKLMVYRNQQLIGSVAYSRTKMGKVSITGLEKYLQKGSQNISVRFAAEKQIIPFALSVSYNTLVPNSSPDCSLDLTTALAKDQVNVSETVRLTTTIKNKKAEGQPSPMALVGIPSGLSPQPWQLKELQEKGTIAYYELSKGYVVFYFRGIEANATRTIHLDLKADVPGVYHAPASNAYLYYTSEHKDWEAGRTHFGEKSGGELTAPGNFM